MTFPILSSASLIFTMFSGSCFHRACVWTFFGPARSIRTQHGISNSWRRNTLCVNQFPPYLWMIMCTIHTLATFMPATTRLWVSPLSSAAFDGKVTIITCVFVPLGEGPKSTVVLIESVLFSHCEILCNLSIGRSDKHSAQLLSAINSGYFNHPLRALFCTVGAKRGQTILNCNWVMRQ
jgi:hypothetical protein